jgi:hypothetical protein
MTVTDCLDYLPILELSGILGYYLGDYLVIAAIALSAICLLISAVIVRAYYRCRYGELIDSHNEWLEILRKAHRPT